MATEKEFDECLNKMREKLFDIDSKEIVRIKLKLVSNLLINPGVAKFRVIKANNKLISKLVGMYSDFFAFFMLIGFEPREEAGEIKYYLDVKREEPLRVELALKVLKRFAREIGLDESQIPTIDSYKSLQFKKDQAQNFDIYKSNVISNNPTAQKGDGNSMLEKKLANLRLARNKEMEDAGIPERFLKVYPVMKNFNPRNFRKTNATTQEQQGDDEGISDKNLIIAAGASIMKRNEESKKFTTKAMRDMESLKNRKIFTKLVLRVQLPNRWVVELYMSPLETLEDLRKIILDKIFNTEVYESIAQPIYFFKTPPKTIFYGEDEKTNFDELRLAPAALIYLGFGFVDAKGNVDSLNLPPIPMEKLINEDVVVEVKPEDKIDIPKGKKVGNFLRSNKNKGQKPKQKPFKKPKWFKL